nr:retrovirus-related Pol polyprotein from transposon TNT 1-94 [Tanacetum cinerariifolium]
MKLPVVENQALKISFGEASGGRGRGRSGMRGRGRNGDFWFLDSGCSNHMCGKREFFCDLDENFKETVMLGDDMSINVMGKGSVRLLVNGFLQVITSVFYIPGLRNNLLISGQLMEKGLEILKRGGSCKIYHLEKGLIREIPMAKNRMFKFFAVAQGKKESCFNSSMEDRARLWHRRYGHLSFNGLNMLTQKEMVRGLPPLGRSSSVCEDCLVGKQQRNPFPQESTWRASRVLELVHADICCLINPLSNRNKRQLTAPYTPQQDGIAERKNKTIMNMVRSMLSVKNMCPEEAWSGFKPSVAYFKVFVSIAYVHIPDYKRVKLDDKSKKCVFLGVSKESKAYRL